MMNRAGLGSMMRGGGPRGLSHMQRGEMILPREAMAQSPGLRYHAAQSMARQGRDPSRYTVGQRNSRNPGTGMWEFFDSYVPGVGYVGEDQMAGTISPYDTHLGGVSGAPEPAQFNVSPERQALIDASQRVQDMNNQRVMERAENVYAPPEFGVTDERRALIDASQRTQAANQMRVDARIDQAANPMPEGDGFLGPAPPPTPAPQPAQQQAQSSPSFDPWNSPQTFDAWRDSRNPTGKNIPNTLFGQVSGAGSEQSPFGPQVGVPGNALPGQMPASSASWSLPGTAPLGMARESNADDPSILNSGYREGGGGMAAGMYGNPMGGWGAPYGNANGGIVPSMTGSPTSNYSNPGPYGGFKSAFRY